MLDEPTLGLDILMRKQFYETLLNEYFDEQRTILVTTHQVEEIEHILTDLLFIDRGRIVLDATMDDVRQTLRAGRGAAGPAGRGARTLGPLARAPGSGAHAHAVSRRGPRPSSDALGEVGVPSVADLFVAVMQGARVMNRFIWLMRREIWEHAPSGSRRQS